MDISETTSDDTDDEPCPQLQPLSRSTSSDREIMEDEAHATTMEHVGSESIIQSHCLPLLSSQNQGPSHLLIAVVTMFGREVHPTCHETTDGNGIEVLGRENCPCPSTNSWTHQSTVREQYQRHCLSTTHKHDPCVMRCRCRSRNGIHVQHHGSIHHKCCHL